ncbi:MAG: C4-type zinc ribbon domain-containing protein [Candidatus Brocadiia bacterium]
MKQTLRKVQQLQEVTRQLAQTRRDRERLALDVDNQARLLEQKRKRAEQAHQQRLDSTKKADAAQLRIEKAEKDVERLQVQLNVTRHQREYDTIRHSIVSHQADIRKWEDEALQALTTADELSDEEDSLQTEVKEAEAELERVKAEVAAQREQYDREIEQLEAERQRLRDEVDPDVLSTYDRLAVSHPDNALVEVRNRICQGCFTRITKQTENLLMRDSRLVRCHSCGRILILTD